MSTEVTSPASHPSLLRSGVRLLALLLCMALAEMWMGNPFLGAFAYMAIYMIVAAIALNGESEGAYDGVSSYRMFARMRLFATVAVELGTMMMFCRMELTMVAVPLAQKYVSMGLWVLLLYGVGWLYSRYARSRWHGQALAEFVVGAGVWVLGDVMMLRSAALLPSVLWNMVWACGIVLIYFALVRFSEDFEAVGKVAGTALDADALRHSNSRLGHRATLVSTGVAMLVMLLWTFGGRRLLADPVLPRVLHVTMMQLPVLFMLTALYFAVRQPLDSRNREKLMHYIEYHTADERVLASLRHQLVRGNKVSFGSRLICWLAIPFFSHKIKGKEHLQKGDYPSVLVCNHGFLYGPIAAALYLPTYFRPWIHDRMLRQDLAEREISISFPWVKKVLGKRLGGALTALAARLTCRLLLSFRPIAVVRGASRDTMSTFDESLAALEEGDNLLIFAEKPKRLNTGDNPDLRNLYTGFAHLGKLYHDATGRRLLFYPVFSNQKQRTISIGEPVQYDPTLPSREAKQAVAEELQRRMEALAR